MKKYEKYKDSGIAWLGDIPEHWEMRRIKYIFKELNERSIGGEETPLSLSKEEGVILSSEKKNRTMESITYIGAKVVHPGNIVFNRFKARLFAITKYEGVVSPDYAIYQCYKNANAKFFVNLFSTDIYREAFNRKSSGIGDGFSRLYSDDLFSMYAPFPPLSEQDKIIDFIESKTSKIDAYVAEKERELRLLEELKQAQIAEIVTHGLDPKVKMKDSGIPWIGMIPEHWEMVKAKYVFKQRKIVVGNKSDEYDLLSLTLKGIIKRDMDNPTGKFPTSFDSYQEVHAGDFVFCLFDNEETPRTVGLSNFEGMITSAYNVFECFNPKIHSKYLLYYYLTIDNAKHMKPIYKGLRKTIPYDSFMRYPIPFPPLCEQNAIVDFIDNKCNKINSLISEMESEIVYLKEYKQRLIADAVTGQIKLF